MLKSLFGKKDNKGRAINHPNELSTGDFVQFQDSFSLPAEIRGQEFKVVKLGSYQYDNEKNVEVTLKNARNDLIYLSVDDEDGDEFLSISRKIERSDVDKIFGLDQFAVIFDGQTGEEIEVNDNVKGFDRWLGQVYHQSCETYAGYFHDNVDSRKVAISNYEEDGGQQFECIELQSDNDEFAINIEIWDGGETDVSLCVYRPLEDILSMMPAK